MPSRPYFLLLCLLVGVVEGKMAVYRSTQGDKSLRGKGLHSKKGGQSLSAGKGKASSADQSKNREPVNSEEDDWNAEDDQEEAPTPSMLPAVIPTGALEQGDGAEDAENGGEAPTASPSPVVIPDARPTPDDDTDSLSPAAIPSGTLEPVDGAEDAENGGDASSSSPSPAEIPNVRPTPNNFEDSPEVEAGMEDPSSSLSLSPSHSPSMIPSFSPTVVISSKPTKMPSFSPTNGWPPEEDETFEESRTLVIDPNDPRAFICGTGSTSAAAPPSTARTLSVTYIYELRLEDLSVNFDETLPRVEAAMAKTVAEALLPCSSRRLLQQESVIRVSSAPEDIEDTKSGCRDTTGCHRMDGRMTLETVGTTGDEEMELVCAALQAIQGSVAFLAASTAGVGAIRYEESSTWCGESIDSVQGETNSGTQLKSSSSSSSLGGGASVAIGIAAVLVLMAGLLVARRRRNETDNDVVTEAPSKDMVGQQVSPSNFSSSQTGFFTGGGYTILADNHSVGPDEQGSFQTYRRHLDLLMHLRRIRGMLMPVYPRRLPCVRCPWTSLIHYQTDYHYSLRKEAQ